MQGLRRAALAALLLACAAATAANPPPTPKLPPLILTDAERAVLAQHPVLRLGVESDWTPIEYIDTNGVYSGVISSYMRALESQLGIRFEIVRKRNFAEVISAFKRGEIDVLSALGRNDAREASMRFTDPYIVFTEGIIVRSSEPYVERLQDFPRGKRLAAITGYESNDRAVANHPHLVPVAVSTTEEALFAVSTGRADLAVASLASAYHLTQIKGLSNLRVAANFDEIEQSMALAVRPGLEALVPLFNASLASIPVSARTVMREQWTQVPVDRGIARSTVLRGTLLGLGVLLLLLGWVAWLLNQQRHRAKLLVRAEDAETQFSAMIEAMPALFWMLRTEAGIPTQLVFFGNRTRGLAGVPSGLKETSFESVLQRIPEEDRTQLQHLMERNLRSMAAFSFEHRRLKRDGTVAGWSHLQVVPSREKGGTVWYGCTIDITDRKQLEAALEESRNQLEELAAGVPGALWQFRREPDGRQHYSYMSDGIVGITGRTPAETNQLMLDKSFVSVHPDDLHILQSLMQRLTVKPGIDGARYRLRALQDQWKWVQVAARAMPPGPDGALVWNGITLDATAQYETEEALRFERQRFQEMADSLSGALWRLRRVPGGRYSFDYVSEGVVNLAGRTAAEIMSGAVKPLEEIVPGDREMVLEALQASAESGKPVEIEYSTYAAGGGIERLLARASVRMENGQPVWTGVLINVSQRHRLQQQLADVRGRIEDIASNFPGAIFQMLRPPDGDTRFTYISEGITRLTGRTPRTSDGRERLEDYRNIHPDDHARVREASAVIIRDGGSTQFDYRLLDANGVPRWVHCAMTARSQPDGNVIINGLLLDAEASKRLEADLRTASERAEAASRAKSRFLANMSHEIRTPMNAVIGLAHIAMTSETSPQQVERIGKIHKAGKALLKLLNDILEYSRLDAGKFTPVVVPFDLREINEGLQLFCSPAAETKGLTFVIDCDSRVRMHWLGDATRIQQVLLNLLTNAVKFTDAGAVTLRVQPLATGDGLSFTVQDTGIGMSAAEVQRVFDAFEQASGETERRHGGSGLGLSICRELVVALGGRISVQSAPGEGTCFIVEMPLQPASIAPPEKPLGDVDQRLARLAGHLAQRDAAGARNSLSALRLVLLPQGRDSELHVLERLLAGFDIEAAQIELARLKARWGIFG